MPSTCITAYPELDTASTAARAAGAIIRDFYDRAAASTYEKQDGSPVTDADLAADRAIREILGDRFPADPILSEEGLDDDARLQSERCWIVDPLDGTEQFIHRTGEFDVLIALVVAGQPVLAAAYQPPTDTLITATLGGGAWLTRGAGGTSRISFDPAPATPRLASSKWFGSPENVALVDHIAANLAVGTQPPAVTGFSPRIFLTPRVIDVMIGIRPGREQIMASEWDFAAPDLIIHEAGGRVTNLRGDRYRYNKQIPRNVGGLIAAADPETHARVLAAVTAVDFPHLRGNR
ncbi:MAG: 3'(2'),5'-bisphosphate nucleotidase CysQ [Thermomicrobiales bacterium]